MTSCPLPLIIQTVIVCIVLVCFLAGEGHWTLPLAGTRTAKCEGCSQFVWECMCLPRGGRQCQGTSLLSRTQCGSLLTVHLINEALADTPWIINEVIQLWLFPSFGERLFTQCLCLDYTIHHNWAYFMCNFMVIIVLSHLEANQTLWTSWFINILISRNVSASHIPSESREQSAESQ